MKLTQLYKQYGEQVFLEYVSKLEKYCSSKLLSESKIVITIDNDNDNVQPTQQIDPMSQKSYVDMVSQKTKDKFIEGAEKLGNFSEPNWVKNLISGMKQAGIHGMNKIEENEKPVTSGEVRQLVKLLVELVRDK